MKVELRNIKYAAFASQETACFTATVVIDGKIEGTVANQGTGGPDEFRGTGTQRGWSGGLELQKKLEEWAKSLPPYTSEFASEPQTHNAETAIAGLLDEFLLRRDLHRRLARKVVFVKDEKLYTATPRRGETPAAAALVFAREKGVTHVLNTMPESEALEAFRKFGTP